MIKNNLLINPFFITGLTDGDGSFWVLINKSKTTKTGWSIVPYYSIAAGNNPANLDMLIKINQYFEEKGKIRLKTFKNSEAYELEFIGLNNCLIIQNHFDKYPLLTYKLVHFKLWSSILNIMKMKNHLTIEGLNEIIGFKAHFKKGLSPVLELNFPNYNLIRKPDYLPNFNNINPHWLAGFINADGHFGLYTSKKENKLQRCEAHFSLIQLNTSRILLEEIVKYLGFGNVYPIVCNSLERNNASRIQISNIKFIVKLINILSETKFYGAKALDFKDFCKGVEIIKTKKHLTVEGFFEIQKIHLQMNSRRIFN
jgi:LAGLIDADG endonuclease